MFNYGQIANEQVCLCGNHYGTGDWTPQQRAAMYKRMCREMPSTMKPSGIDYVRSWEASHGPIHYAMGSVGLNMGEFNKADKGRDIIGPIFSDR